MKNNFILISMRQDYFYNKKELRFCIDTKLIDWVLFLGFKPLLVSDLKTLDSFFVQSSFKINGIILLFHVLELLAECILMELKLL